MESFSCRFKNSEELMYIVTSDVRARKTNNCDQVPYKNKYWRGTKFGELPRNHQV